MAIGGLGKGLGALLGDLESPNVSGYFEADIYKLDPNPQQPRKQFDEEHLNELASSIKQHGIVQPILVRENGDRYLIVAGERRWRAAQIAGLERVPVISRQFDDRELLEVSLIENIQRNNLNPLEEAAAIKFLMEQHDLTHEEVADRLGKSRPAITNSVRLLNLPETVQGVLLKGDITAGHARALLSIQNPARATELAERIIHQGLSVRATETMVNKENKPELYAPRKRASLSPELAEFEEQLQQLLGTRVKITGDERRGRLTIDYFGTEQLDRLYELLTGDEYA